MGGEDLEKLIEEAHGMLPDRPRLSQAEAKNGPRWLLTRQVLCEVDEERKRQDAKWGEQNHPDGTGHAWDLKAGSATEDCDNAFRDGHGTWRHILAEEFWEALAEDDCPTLRAELIQVAAVAVAWVEAIDRRAALKETKP